MVLLRKSSLLPSIFFFLFARISSFSKHTVCNQSVPAENSSVCCMLFIFIDSMHRICLSNKCFFTTFSDSVFSCFNWVGCYCWGPRQSQHYFDLSIAMINLPQGWLILIQGQDQLSYVDIIVWNGCHFWSPSQCQDYLNGPWQ